MWYGDRSSRHCRWCGNQYHASRPIGKDGFCKSACKQAHHRAYKKYVTAKQPATRPGLDHKVTRKTKKKTG